MISTTLLYGSEGTGWDPVPVVLARLGLADELNVSLKRFPSRWQFYKNGWGHWGTEFEAKKDAELFFRKNKVRDSDHGVKGEISLVTDYDLFDDSEDDYIVCDMDGILVPFFIEDYRYKSDTVVLLKLENVNDEIAAREFSNRMVYYPLNKVEQEELTDDMSWNGLIGFEVVDKQHDIECTF